MSSDLNKSRDPAISAEAPIKLFIDLLSIIILGKSEEQMPGGFPDFMMVFGILSSVFDYLAFGVLLLVYKSPMTLFRTGWFVESVVSASLIVLVVRSKGPFFKSSPGKYLLITTLVIVGVTLVLPFTLLGRLFGFASLPISVLIMMVTIVVLYLISGEVVKRIFYKRVKF